MSKNKNSIATFFDKYSRHLVIGIALSCLIGSCSLNSSTSRIIRNQSAVIDSLGNALDRSQQQIRVQVQIDQLKSSKRALYEQNAVVRTTSRPDDLMRQYDQEIDSLEQELKR